MKQKKSFGNLDPISNLTQDEKKEVDSEIQDVIKKLKKNPNMYSEEVNREKDLAESVIMPIINRSKEKKSLRDEKDQTKSELNDKNNILNKASKESRNDLAGEVDDSESLLKKQNEDSQVYLDQNRSLKNEKKKVLDEIKPVEDKRKNYKEYLEGLKTRSNNDSDLGGYLSKKDKKLINDEAQQALDWLDKNQNSSLKELRENEKKLEDKIGKILDDAEKKKKNR